ncbi:hypothetical protein QBC38DRAFT_523144, partial [Podospora fimiseda]
RHLATSYQTSKWCQSCQKLRGKKETWGDPVYLPPRWNDSEGRRASRWRLLKMLERDLIKTYHLCHYCNILHRCLLPGFNSITQPLQPMVSCRWAENIGPNYFNLARITFYSAHQAMESARNKDDPLPTKTSWRLFNQKSLIPSPTTVSCKPLPALTYNSPWSDHPLSKSDPTAYLGIKVKVSMEAAAVPNTSSTNSLFIHTTQHVFIPSEMLFTPKDKNQNPPRNCFKRKWLGFQVCRHQASYHPRSALLRIDNATRTAEDNLGLEFFENEKKWARTGSNKKRYTNGDECFSCQTRWKTTRIVHGEKGIEGIMDVWQNLGNCMEDERAEGCDRYETGARGRWAMSWYTALGLDDLEMFERTPDGTATKMDIVRGDFLRKEFRRYINWDRFHQRHDGFVTVDVYWEQCQLEAKQPPWEKELSKFFWWCENKEGTSALEELEKGL